MRHFFGIFFITFSQLVIAQQIRCVSVLDNGDIEIRWSIFNDQSKNFIAYYIYHSNIFNATYNCIDSITNINQNVYIHLNANGQNQTNYYYVISKYEDGGLFYFTQSNDTLQNIILSSSVDVQGNVSLTWNKNKNPLLNSTKPYCQIQELTNNNWTMLDSTDKTNYTFKSHSCGNNVSYRITYYDNLSCQSISSVTTINYKDITPPSTPTLDSVTITTNNKILLGWNSVPDKDVAGYIIYKQQNNAWVPTDTIKETFYVDSLVNPLTTIQAYRIAAIDKCLNTSPMSYPQKNFQLTSTQTNCPLSINLEWTEYFNNNNQLDSFLIFYSNDNISFHKLASVSNTTKNFTHSNLLPNTTYYYKIQAVNSNKTITASSNRTLQTTKNFIRPKFCYLIQASVIDNQYVELKFYADTSTRNQTLQIERKVNSSSNFSKIAEITGFNQSILTYIDRDVNVSNNFYTYRIQVLDSCKMPVLTSNPATTILLTLQPANNNEVLLEWNEYKQWDADVFEYQVYKGDNVTGKYSYNQSLTQTQCYDNYEDLLNQGISQPAYFVEAIENDGNKYGFKGKSRSNVVTLKQENYIFMANAFSPHGKNNTIKPVCLNFNDVKFYQYRIFDRWGNLVFETTDVNTAWDGSFNGRYVKEGIYTYYIFVKFNNGETQKKVGTILVYY